MTPSTTAFARLGSLSALCLAVALSLAACGNRRDAATQTAAKVNKEEITVHQINFVLQQQRGLRPEQADAASKQILDRLIDQQLSLQKAEEQKIDRDPRVVQQIEMAKREIVSRAYLERVGERATKPTEDEVKKYYDDKPALFSERRIYNIQEIGVEAKPEQIATLREQLSAAKNITVFVDYLKANGYKFAANQAVRAAEQLPLPSVESFARMKDGQAMVVPAANGVQVVVLAGSRSEPVSLDKAKGAIELYLLNERKRKLIEEDVRTLRGAAKIEFIGKFVPGAAAASAPGAAAPAAPTAGDAATPAAPAGSAALSSDDISKGLGLKK